MVEVELKFEVSTAEAQSAIKKLKRLGYEITKPRTYDTTVMYDNPQQLMQITDGRVRLRKNDAKSRLSYKKPLTREGVKKEVEYEIDVSDFDTTHNILTSMEFTPSSSYERYRTVIMKDDKHIAVTIDEYPFATFIEIEGEEEEIKALARDLGFDLKDNRTEPCDTLFQEWRKKRDLPFRPHMLFNDYNK